MKRNNVRHRADRVGVGSKLAREAEDGLNTNNLRPDIQATKWLSSVSALGVK